MGLEPGEPLASGRAAEVFDQGDGTVLRRYRQPDHNAEPEARLMRWVAARGYPVPPVHQAEGRDLVMDRIDGPTLLDDLEARPWRLVAHARTLARLQRQLNDLAAPDWLPTADGVLAGDAVLHVDLHPMNVIQSPTGPVVIDWTNGCRGAPSFDAAMTVVLMSTFELTGVRDRLGRSVLVHAFKRSRGSRLVADALAAACRFRLADPNVTDAERAAIHRLLAGTASAGPRR